MSGNSGKNSGSFARGIFRRAAKQEPAAQNSMRPDAEPSFTINKVQTHMGIQEHRSKTSENVSAAGIRNLTKEGFVVYNLPEANEIFVSKPSDSAYLDEDEPYLIRVSNEVFAAEESMPSLNIVRPQMKEIVCSQPADVFENALAKETLEDIDYDEIIVKKSTGVREELFSPGYSVSKIEEECRTHDGMPAGIACTNTGAMEMPMMHSTVEYIEEPAAEVEILEVEGLYTENNAPTNKAVVGAHIESSFVGKVQDLRVATEGAGAVNRTPMMTLPPAMHVEIIEETSETETDTVFRVSDVVADILKLTVPGINEDVMAMADLPADRELHIPEDGLESYDGKFKLHKTSVSFDFGENKLRTIGSSLNFTF